MEDVEGRLGSSAYGMCSITHFNLCLKGMSVLRASSKILLCDCPSKKEAIKVELS